MWRSWVDKINTSQRSSPEEAEAIQHTYTAEEMQRRKQLETELQDAWQQCEDLLSSEQERSDRFVQQFLPAFCTLYSSHPAHAAFTALPNERAFMGMLSRHFLAALRKIPEQGSKAESSKVLMYSLRSKWRLFYIIRALQIVANGPVVFLNMMLQQRVPSLIIKIFRSFLDLPANDGDNDEDNIHDSDDLVSEEDAGGAVADMMACFVRDPTILRRLIVDDTFYTMLRLVSTKPVAWDNIMDTPFFHWKEKIITILKSVPSDAEVVQHIHSRRFVEVMAQVWKEDIKDRQRLLLHDYMNFALELDLVAHLAKMSIDTASTGLYDELQSANLYHIAFTVLSASHQEDKSIDHKIRVVRTMTELAFVGKGVGSPGITDGLPYQHDDFVFPKPNLAAEGALVRNLAAFQLLQNLLLYPHSSCQVDGVSTATASSSSSKTVAPELRTPAFEGIYNVLTKDAANYFLLERTNVLPLLIETLDRYNTSIQSGILDLLQFVMIDLNFVPLKELAVLSLHLQSTADGQLVGFICQRSTRMVQRAPKLLRVFQESGMINMIGLLMSKVTDALNRERDVPGARDDARAPFIQHCLEQFDAIIDCVVALIANPTNAMVFRKSYTGNVFDLLYHAETQVGTLRLFEALSQHDGSGTSTGEASYAFSRMMEAIQGIPRSELAFRIEILATIKRILLRFPSTRDVLRESGGYVTLTSMIVALEDAFAPREDELAASSVSVARNVLAQVLDVLMESMRDHAINARFFARHVGYTALEDALLLTGALNSNASENDKTMDDNAVALFGMLFAFMVQDASLQSLFSGTHDHTLVSTEPMAATDLPAFVEKTINRPQFVIAHPEMAMVILHLQQRAAKTCKASDASDASDLRCALSRAVLQGLLALSRANRRNQIALNRSGFMLECLQRVFPKDKNEDEQDKEDSNEDKQVLFKMITKLLAMGVGDKELHYLFQCFGTNGELLPLDDPQASAVMDLILQGTTRSRWPNFLHFDLALPLASTTTTTPCLDFPTLTQFPPPSQGYTLTMWFHMEKWDKGHDLVLWSVYDDQRLAFQVYLDASTGHLCVYCINSKQVSQFDAVTFQPGYWYHLALVHHRSRLGNSMSTITLVLNGIWIEQIRFMYPSASTRGFVRAVFAGTDSHKRQNQQKVGSEVVHNVWNMGPTYLFGDVLEVDVLNLYFYLGARYMALYKDSLRQFQTYDASTALFLNLDGRNAKRRDLQRGMLANVMRGGPSASAAANAASQKIILAVTATQCLAYGADTGLINASLDYDTRKYANASEMHRVVLNGALSKLQRAIVATASYGYLLGKPGIAFPYGLDDATWKIGGFALALNMISRANTSDLLLKSMRVLIEMVQYSWRNSEDMERRHGYEILANMLKHKRELMTVEFLELLLSFVGKNTAVPEKSVISNPFAYRSVILNFEVWKKTSIDVQRLHLDQFILFMQTSHHRSFNVRRLVKVHLVKKMLLAFRMNIYAKELIPHVVQALKAITLVNWTTESIRALATFVASTASINAPAKPKTSARRSRLPRVNTLSIATSTVPSEDSSGASGPAHLITDARQWSLEHASKTVFMCNIVMEMLHDILCQADRPEYVHKLTATVTNKWPLLFFAPGTDPFTVVLASRILLHVLHVEGSSYTNKFGIASDGFLVMERLLAHFWHVTPLYEIFTVFFLGESVARFPLQDKFDLDRIQSFVIQQQQPSPRSHSSSSSSSPVIPAIWPMIASLLVAFAKQTLRSGAPERDDHEAMTRLLQQLIMMYSDLYKSRSDVQDAVHRSEWIDAIVELLFVFVIHEPFMTLLGELQAKENAEFDDTYAPSPSSMPTPGAIGQMFSPVDARPADASPSTPTDPASIIKRGGATSFVTKTSPHLNKKTGAMATKLRSVHWKQNATMSDIKPLDSPALEAILQWIVDMNLVCILDATDKNLTVLNMFLDSYPPSSVDAQLKFESYLWTHILQNLKSTLQLDEQVLQTNGILLNIAKFCQITADAVLQGRFINGAEQTYDLLATVLETLMRLEEEQKRRAPPDHVVATLYKSFNRMVLLKISDLEQDDMPIDQMAAFLNYCIHHQKIILNANNKDQEFLRCFCYHLYHFLVDHDDSLKNDALNIWKLLILQKQDAIASAFKAVPSGDDLMHGFYQMLEMDNESFFMWVDSRKVELNLLFKEHIFRSWEAVIMQEHKASRETWKAHQLRRIAKLKRVQKRQAKDDNTFDDYNTKTAAWSQSIQEMEFSRFTRALQDNDMHDNFMRTEWARMNDDLVRERAIWGPKEWQANGKSTWVLDFTEGRYRTRRKVRRLDNCSESAGAIYQPKVVAPADNEQDQEAEKPDAAAFQGATDGADAQDFSDKLMMSMEGDPDKESAKDNDDSGSEPIDEGNDEEEIAYEENKNHKVLRLLDAGDMVVDVYNVSQIEGLDAREGLLLLCKNHIYLIDNFFQRADGEVVEIWDVPKHERDEYLLLLAQAAGMETNHELFASGDLHACRKWANVDLREVFKRRFLFRDVALELFFADGQNALITVSKAERDELFNKLAGRTTASDNDDKSSSIFGHGEKESSSSLGNAFRFVSIFSNSTLQDLTSKWQRREITNFQYLMYLNAIAGRSYNDLTQYPVFPWILADYESKQVDLTDPASYRDLTKPMGAQTAERREEFADRYRQWGETNDPAPAFHYGTHYSSAMIVCSFLIRLEPFTQHYLKLQGGTFDHADRLFDSVGKAWESASEKNMGDVRELIPEFFCLPEFLENVNKFNFGTKQGSGESIDSVALPPWASGDPKIFVHRHREALESEYVSSHLHAWIDLIFGCKQQGKAAIDALNVFHHVSYEGAVDLDAITDIVEKTATIGIINNFGQTPRQLFKKAHPARLPPSNDPQVLGFYPLRHHLKKLIQAVFPLRDIQAQVGNIEVLNDRLLVGTVQQAFMPSDGMHYVEWGYSDNSLRLYQTDSGKIMHVFENLHQGFISNVCFPDSRTMVTGGTDHVVSLWRIQRGKQITFELEKVLRGHDGAITCIATSQSYSVIATGSQDKTVILWDLNRMNYVRSLVGHEGPVHLVAVNDATGDIVTCAGNVLRIWSINGELYLSKAVCPSSEQVLSCAIYDPKPNEWSTRDLIITGHHNGVVKFWEKDVVIDESTGESKWALNLVYQLQHNNRVDSAYDMSDIVSLYLTSKRTLLTGNRHGQVYSFVLPDTMETVHYVKEDRGKECMECRKSFSVLDRKSYCRACGGAFCNACISHVVSIPVPDKSARFCKHCHEVLLDDR